MAYSPYAHMSPTEMAHQKLQEKLKQQEAAKEAGRKTNEAMARAQEETAIRQIAEKMPGYESALGGEEFDYLREQAYGEGPLDAYKGLREQQEALTAGEMERIQRGLGQEIQDIDVGRAGQMANIYSGLAMGGGLSSGARERMAAGGLEQALQQRQGARFGAESARQAAQQEMRQGLLGIGEKEAGTRLDMQTKIADAIRAEKERKQRRELEIWQKQADIEAGIQTAKSQERIAEKTKPEEGK